ncbi:MAG TPA: phosphoribosylamine--glycine ligase family protein, partial [Caldisericia bacterium]|nr:phosphoribosylamine--glycine ligase family protein [Caldisericia bacterium]
MSSKKLNVLVLGGGGREHVICWKLSQSRRINNLFCIPGNSGIERIAKIIPNMNITDFNRIKEFS